MEYGLAGDMECQLGGSGSRQLSRNRLGLLAGSRADAMAEVRRLMGSVSLAIGSP